MGETWRHVDAGAVGPVENQALMGDLARDAILGGTPILQTSVWGATHLNVGAFDDIDATTDLAAAARLGVTVIRRPMAGGGTAFYDARCSVMWGLLRSKDGHRDLDRELAAFQPIVLDALDHLGCRAVQFSGSADLRLPDDRKLGGMSANDFGPLVSVGGFLNIARPDVDLYLQVARVPHEKFRDKAVKDLREYLCTAEEVAGHPVGYAEFRDALLAAAKDAGIVVESMPAPKLDDTVLNKVRRKIASDDAVRKISSERFAAEHPAERVGFGNHKGRKLVRIGVALDAGGTVVAAMVSGDLHVSPPDTLDRIAGALERVPSDDATALRTRIAAVLDADDVHQADATMGVTTDDFLAALTTAIATARENS